MKIKLVYLTTDPGAGGGPQHVYHLLKGVDKGIFGCSLISPEKSNIKNQISKIKVTDQKSKIKSYQLQNKGSVFEKVAELRSILQKIKAEGYPFAPLVLHAHSPESLFLANRAIRGLGIYLVYTDHLWTRDYHTRSWFRDQVQLLGIRQALRPVSKVIAVSKAVADFLVKKHLAKKEKVVIIPPVVWKLPKYHLEKKSHPSGPLVVKTVIGSIGALNRIKGYDSMIEAIHLLVLKNLKFTVEIIGDGPDKANLEALIDCCKLKSVVKLLGSVPSEELTKYYRNWDIYVQPSTSETFGLGVLEAMHFGLPIVASRAGALPELVENGETGILTQISNPKSLARGLEELLINDRLREKFGRAGRKKAEGEQFDGRQNVKKIEEIYKEITSYGIEKVS